MSTETPWFEVSYVSVDGTKASNLLVRETSKEYRHEVDVKHIAGTNRVTVTDNGVSEKMMSLSFYFYDDKVSVDEAKQIIDAIYNGGEVDVVLKPAFTKSENFRKILEKKNGGKLYHPVSDVVNVVPISITEKIDMVNSVGMAVVNVSFLEATIQKSSVKSSKETINDINIHSVLTTSAITKDALGKAEVTTTMQNQCLKDKPLDK